MFEKEIQEYEALLKVYREKVTDRMAMDDLKEYNEILFSANSCAIEGNSFSVNDTRELKEKGLGVIPQGKTLFEQDRRLLCGTALQFVCKPVQDTICLWTHCRRTCLADQRRRTQQRTEGKPAACEMHAYCSSYGRMVT